MRIPTFSRQSTSDTTETAERPAATGTVTRPREDNTTEVRPTPVRPRRDDEDTLRDLPPAPPPASRRTEPPAPPRPAGTAPVERPADRDAADAVTTGPKPRASLLATLGLILGVASVLLVLSGPLLGYGIGVAVLALILSLSGIHATGKRHVAGKMDALLGLVLSLGAIVLGVLALTGSLSWLGTDVQPVNTLREWLDAQTVNRF
ncbi:hypothetical protein Aab01nite_21060 [Paractinoplanes abujensis]|uniref:Uncharacterized protein n=1 Tax=Paractinoplanes abujensis TaxID=882441 RepID=A0A7W7D0I6_9ACTN|nr:hypothetical protein [Actinoplanes abujensis]MBB4697010.1 hypothetical protein [Actinoplanes abujensis]GID18516.1 hypothetical protein Aab01nite_21060 [Actinoplanes abujensis]